MPTKTLDQRLKELSNFRALCQARTKTYKYRQALKLFKELDKCIEANQLSLAEEIALSINRVRVGILNGVVKRQKKAKKEDEITAQPQPSTANQLMKKFGYIDGPDPEEDES